MFYVPEILSHKNKTELSLVYYLSTTKNPKNSIKKEVVEINFSKVIDQMRNPKIPFALRLYSYLIKGLVQIWVIKVDFYRGKINSLFVEKDMPRKKSTRRMTIRDNINLRVIDQVINDENVEYFEISSFRDRHHEQFDNMISADAFDFDGVTDNSNSLQNVRNIRHPVHLVKIDNKIEIGFDEIWIKKIKPDHNEFPDLEDCFVKRMFEDKISRYKAARERDNLFEIDLVDTVSVEDPRISSVTSASVNASINSNITKDEDVLERSPAMWFYNLLVAASEGRMILKQEEPFGMIDIEYPSYL